MVELGPVLLVAAVALTLVGTAATTALLRPDSAVDAAVTAGVTAGTGVVVVMLLAGIPGLLVPGVVLAAHAGWALTAVVLLRRRHGVWLPRPAVSGRDVRAAVRDHPWSAAVVGLAALALGWQLVVAVVLPPFAYDGLTYHLTSVATWVQQADIAPTPLSLCCARYPATPELLFAWPAVLLGDDTLVDTVQIPFAVLGALATAGIGRTAGLSRAGSAAAGGLFAVTPALLTQAPTNYVDVMLAAAVLAALHALVRYAVTAAPQRLVVVGLGAGLALGTKGTGILWAAALLLAAATVAAVAARRGRTAARAAAVAVLATAVGCLALGGWWYARNWWDTGNPMHPFEVAIAGLELFDGPIRIDDVVQPPPAGADAPWPVAVARSWAADLDFWNQGSYDYQQRSGGLGPLWPWLGLPLLVPFTARLVARRDPALLVPVVVAAVLLVQPFRWWARFTLPLSALGAIAVVGVAEWARRRWMRGTVRGAALLLAAAGVALSSVAVDPAARSAPLPATRLVGLIGAAPPERTLGRLFHPEYAFLDRVPPDATVVLDRGADAVRFVSPLFGPAYSRTVLPADGGIPPPGSWVVTARGRPLDGVLSADPRRLLDSDVRGVRVWRPGAGEAG